MQGFVIFFLLPKNSRAHYLAKPYPSQQQKNYLCWESQIMGFALINADPTSCQAFIVY